MVNEKYWVWLTNISGLGIKSIKALLDIYKTPEAIFEETNFDKISGLRADVRKYLTQKDMTRVENIYADLAKCGASVITIDDTELYPPLLREITDAPYVIYVNGKMPIWEKTFTIGIVGTRHCTGYGVRAAEMFAGELARRGIAIVSGIARGIDAVAERAAVDNGGITVSVLGCGIDVVYPKENEGLYRRCRQNGILLSEFPPGTRPFASNFPRRNRIIAALSRGIIVAEAPKSSGALITADLAAEYGRDVFVVPGSIFTYTFEGNMRLMSEGAKPIQTVDDILDEYGYIKFPKPSSVRTTRDLKRGTKRQNGKNAVPKVNEGNKSDRKVENVTVNEKKSEKKSKKPAPDVKSLNPVAAKIVWLLAERELSDDEISRELNIPVNEISTELIMLEIDGTVIRRSDNRYGIS